MTLKKQKSQGKAVEVTMNSKEENSITLGTFVLISSKNSASVNGPLPVKSIAVGKLF
jgi:hypothetical protein